MKISVKGRPKILCWQSRSGDVRLISAARPQVAVCAADVELSPSTKRAIADVGPASAIDALAWPVLMWPAIARTFNSVLPRSWAVTPESSEGLQDPSVSLELSAAVMGQMPTWLVNDLTEEGVGLAIRRTQKSLGLAVSALNLPHLQYVWPREDRYSWTLLRGDSEGDEELIEGRHGGEVTAADVSKLRDVGIGVVPDVQWMFDNGHGAQVPQCELMRLCEQALLSRSRA